MNVKFYSPIGFAERLQEMMFERNYNQTTLAREIGVDRKTVMAWCNDRIAPNVTMLARICSTLNVSADWLIFGRG